MVMVAILVMRPGLFQGYHASGKSRGNLFFSRSGKFANCQGNMELLVNVRELSGNFENNRFKSNY